jgi:uncharacterized membrane protein
MHAQDPRLRLSDADRDEAIVQLSDHYAAGRLDREEFDERSDAVWTARTFGDLTPIFADLAPVRHERARVARGGWFPVRFLPLLVGLIALTVVTHIPFVLLAFLGCVFLFGRRRRHWLR